MKRSKLSLAIIALVLGVVVSAFSTKPLQAGFWSFDGSNYTFRGTTEPVAEQHCLEAAQTICYEERDEQGSVIGTVENGPYTP